MQNIIEFRIKGQPQGKARPRFNGNHTYTPRATRDYEHLVRTSYIKQCGNQMNDFNKITIKAYFEIPKSATKKERAEIIEGKRINKKPDIDNIIKIILDSLNGLAYADDKQITKIEASKSYTLGDPEVWVILEKEM